MGNGYSQFGRNIDRYCSDDSVEDDQDARPQVYMDSGPDDQNPTIIVVHSNKRSPHGQNHSYAAGYDPGGTSYGIRRQPSGYGSYSGYGRHGDATAVQHSFAPMTSEQIYQDVRPFDANPRVHAYIRQFNADIVALQEETRQALRRMESTHEEIDQLKQSSDFETMKQAIKSAVIRQHQQEYSRIGGGGGGITKVVSSNGAMAGLPLKSLSPGVINTYYRYTRLQESYSQYVSEFSSAANREKMYIKYNAPILELCRKDHSNARLNKSLERAEAFFVEQMRETDAHYGPALVDRFDNSSGAIQADGDQLLLEDELGNEIEPMGERDALFDTRSAQRIKKQTEIVDLIRKVTAHNMQLRGHTDLIAEELDANSILDRQCGSSGLITSEYINNLLDDPLLPVISEPQYKVTATIDEALTETPAKVPPIAVVPRLDGRRDLTSSSTNNLAEGTVISVNQSRVAQPCKEDTERQAAFVPA